MDRGGWHRTLTSCCPAPVPWGSEDPVFCPCKDRHLVAGGHLALHTHTVAKAAECSSQHLQRASASLPSVKNGDDNIKCDTHLTVSEAVISPAAAGE